MLITRDWAVITGATSGIGLAFTDVLAQHGINLLMTGRDGKKLATRATVLEKEYGIKTIIYTGDLTIDEEMEGLVKLCASSHVRIKYLINNAGFGHYASFFKNNWDRERDMIDLNIKAMTYLAKAIGALMAKKGEGYILNLGSTASFVPGPNMAVYYASKAYVLSLSQAIHHEFKAHDVSVTVYCPGPTQTGFAESAKAQQTSLFRGQLPSAQAVAEYGFKAMLKGKPVIIYGWRNKIFVWLTRFIPRRFVAGIIAKLQD